MSDAPSSTCADDTAPAPGSAFASPAGVPASRPAAACATGSTVLTGTVRPPKAESDLEVLLRRFGVESVIVGRRSLIHFLNAVGVPCSERSINRIHAQDKRRRAVMGSHGLVYTNQEVAAYAKALTKARLEDILSDELRRAEKTQAQEFRDRFSSLGHLFVAADFDHSLRTFTPLLGRSGMYATTLRSNARSWVFEHKRVGPYPIIEYSKSVDRHPSESVLAAIPNVAAAPWEAPPLLAFYEMRGGRFSTVVVPARVYGYEGIDADVPAMIAVSHPRRMNLAKCAIDRSPLCWLVVWCRGTRVSQMTLAPAPRTTVAAPVGTPPRGAIG